MRIASIAATVAAMFLGTSPGIAQDTTEPHCGSFVMTTSPDHRDVVDNDPPGKSPGDFRLSENDITMDDELVGSNYVMGTLLPSDNDDLMLAIVISEFPNGTVISLGSLHSPNPLDATHPIRGEPVLATIGGTGAFANARGTVTAPVAEDGTRRFTFNLHCD